MRQQQQNPYLERPDVFDDEHADPKNFGIGATMPPRTTDQVFADQLVAQTGGDPEGDVPRLVPGSIHNV